jgi:hypothetical protein
VAGISVLDRDQATGLVATVPAVVFTAGGRTRIGPGGERLEELLG